MKAVLSGGGTAGHINPALALAEELGRRGWEVLFAGTPTGVEAKLVADAGIPFKGFAASGFNRKKPLSLIKGVATIQKSTGAAKRWFKEIEPDVVVGFGGYVCVPVGRAAESLGIPVTVHEQNSVMGMANRYLAKRAAAVCVTYEGTADGVCDPRIVHVTGNPVRAEIEALEAPEARLAGRTGPLRLLVFGGSLGAQVLNETVPKALALFDKERRPQVVHQTGVKNVEKVRALYDSLGIEADVRGFIDDMASAYRDSDLVLCRSGAMTVSELCAAGAASILVPFVVKTTQHQLGNARYMQDNGAAILLEQPQLTPEHLFGILMSTNRDKILAMAQKARALARPHAAQAVADIIERAAGQV